MPISILLSLRRKVVQISFLYLMTTFVGLGLILVILRAAHFGEVLRDFGISLLVAGTVGLGVELVARREMEKVLGDLTGEKVSQYTGELQSALQKIDQQARIDSEKFHHAQEDALSKLEELRTLVARVNGLHEAGVRRLSPRREDNLLLDFIAKAEPGSTIRILALCLNTLANNTGRDLFKRKLREGCQIRMLLLDPDANTMLDERARQENRKTDEDIREFNDQVRIWNSMHSKIVQTLTADKKVPGNIDLGYYQSLPSCFLIDNGHLMLVGFYLHGCRGDQCPHLEIEQRHKGFYQQFDRHFEALWARRTVPLERRKVNDPVEKERRGLRLT
jgi:hypothetical protein